MVLHSKLTSTYTKTIFCAYASVCVLCVVADAVCVCMCAHVCVSMCVCVVCVHACVCMCVSMCVCVQDAGKLGTAACNTLRFGIARDTSTMANGSSHI